jgi:hypothetical protein
MARSHTVDFVDRVWGRVTTTVEENPSPSRISELLAASRGRQLRGVAFEGTLFLFPAWEATHFHVREAFGLPEVHRGGGCDLWVVDEGGGPLSDEWETSENDPVRDGMRLILGRDRDVPAIARLARWFDAPSENVSVAFR